MTSYTSPSPSSPRPSPAAAFGSFCGAAVGSVRGLRREAGEMAEGSLRAIRIGLTRMPPWKALPALLAAARSGPHLGALYAMSAAARPEKIAVVDSSGAMTYEALEERANRLAHHVRERGADHGRLAIILPNCREALEAIGAAAKLHMAPVPVNTRFQVDEIERLLDKQKVSVVVVDEALRDRVRGFDGLVLVRGDDYEYRLATAEPAPPPAAWNLSAPPMVIHTSGTTGHPKGAERALAVSGPALAPAALAFLARVPFSPDDVVVNPAPLFHSLGLVGALVGVGLGQTQVFQEHFDADEWCRLVAEHRATASVLVPVMLRRVLDADPVLLDRVDRDRLRWILCSGSALPPKVAADALDRFGPVVRNLYGSTEAGWVTIATAGDMADRTGTVGRAMPGVELRIVDEHGLDVSTGEVGEIVVRSDTVFDGYTGEPDAGDRDRGAREVVDDRSGGYPLGDLGHLDTDGFLYVDDRKDDMVVTGGENVYPAEVERVLDEAPGVSHAAVVGVGDEEYGKVLAAFVVGEGVDPDAVERHVRSRIANFKVPKYLWVVDALPETPTGKVLRRDLVDEAARRLDV